MESPQNYEAANCLISLTKSRSVEVDLTIVKKIHKLIRNNRITCHIDPLDVAENVFASIASILCNKVRVALYLLGSKKDDPFVEHLPRNEATLAHTPLRDYLRGYDMCSSERCRLTIEHYVKALSVCFTKLGKGDRQTFFANLNNLSMLLSIGSKEEECCSESFQVAVLNYAKSIFLRIYPNDMFQQLDEGDIANAQQAVGNSTHHLCGHHKLEENKKDIDAFFCLMKIIQTVLQNIMQKKKKIKLKNLKLLFIILKKINKNVYILKKCFGAISLNLFLLYRTFHVKEIQKLIVKVFAMCVDKMLLFCLNGQVKLGEANLGENNLGENNLVENYFGGDPKWGSSPTCGREQECLSSLQSLGGPPKARSSAPFVGQRPHGEAVNEAGHKVMDDAGPPPPHNAPTEQPSEDETIIANVHFICYYVLTNYGDEIVREVSHLCKIIIKYWRIVHRNLTLMGYFVLLSELLSEGGDSFAARLELLLGSRSFSELLNVRRLSVGQSGGESSDSGIATGIALANQPGDHPGDALTPPGPSLQDDLHAIFTNLIKSLQPDGHPLVHLPPEANCTLERLNQNVGTYYFRHLYNVFLLRRQNEIYLLRFLRGYLYFHFFNSHTNEVPVARGHLSVNYFLSLYETSNVDCVRRGTYHPQRDPSTILSEDNSLYSLNVYEQLTQRGSSCAGDKTNWAPTRFPHFRNIKDGLKMQDVGLIGDVSILFFLLTSESELENHLNEVMLSAWDNPREGTKRETKREELVLTRKWWEEIHHFTNSIDWAKQRNSKEEICIPSQADSTGNLAPTEDACREEEEPPLRRKCKCLHFINFYMDALIVMLCTYARVQLEGENQTETTSIMRRNQLADATNNQPLPKQALQNELVKDVLQEYANLYKSYFHLALQMKWSRGAPNLRMTMEKVLLFLTSKRVKKAHLIGAAGEGGHTKGEHETDLRHYYLSLLLICMNKCFCVSSLCGYEDLMEKYFCKNFVFFLLNVSSPCSYVRELAQYTIQNVHLCLHGGVCSEGEAPSDSCISARTGRRGVLCVPAHGSSVVDGVPGGEAVPLDVVAASVYAGAANPANSNDVTSRGPPQVDRMEDILNRNSEAISAYVYKKIINLDSIHSCRKISTLTQLLVTHHYCHVYLFKDICVHIIKYSRRMQFLHLDRQRKDEMAVLILTVFNYVLYLFYEHISRKRVELCVRGGYVEQVKRRLLHGEARVNFGHLRGAVGGSGGSGEGGSEDDHPAVPLRAPPGTGTPRSILHRQDEQKKKKKLFLRNLLLFKFHGDLFNVVHLDTVSSEEAKKNSFKKIEEDMKNIMNKARENIPCERLVNLLVDDDFCDLYDEEGGSNTSARRSPGEGPTNDLKDNHYISGRKYHQEVHYPDIRHTAEHIFHFAKKFLCHEDVYVRFSAHLCVLRCLFIFSTRLYELYPKIYQLWGYVKINFRKNEYMNDIVLLNIINYVATIDDKFSPNLILSDIIPELFRKLEKLEMGREMPKQSFEHRFLLNAMLLLVNVSKEESCFEHIHPFAMHFCLKCLREGVDEQIKRLALNIICNFFLSDIPKIGRAIQNVRAVKERVDQMHGKSGTTEGKLHALFLSSIVKDVSIEQPLLFLSCFLQLQNLRDVLSLAFHVDHSMLNFLSIYFEFLQMKCRYKCRLHQHCLVVSSHFSGGGVETRGGGTPGLSQSLV
ncbi:conserved Plasmodium protein, unknown function [Plasmodium vivax]|uniref:Uncharacterized protein n=1 Tax=Plasmodium vivax TaxID=5855 RepID=A0A1G4GRH7_PLAVI|nr:conserved Plasmodium protein, unknown function [Plasmodium vivax]